MAQGNISPQNQAIAGFVASFPESVSEQFDTYQKRVVVPGDDGAYGTEAFFRRSFSLTGLPEVGHLCVALYDTAGPAYDPKRRGNMMHHEAGLALLLRHAETVENRAALQAAETRGIEREVAERLALVFERLVPRVWELDGQPVFLRTGQVSPSFLPLR